MIENSDPNFAIFGRNPELVLELLKKRLRSRQKNDGRKFGLIIEGGGMKSIIAGGMLLALNEFAGNNLFDAVYGTSAGSLGGAFFLSGQIPYGIALYYEDLATERFINLARIPPRFDIDFMIDILTHKRRLDISSIKRHETELVIASTEITSGEQHYFTSREDTPILTAIKASCALPVFYDKPVEINGARYADGGTINNHLIKKTLADGCTDLLVLFTRPRKREYYRMKVSSWFEDARMKKYGPNFASAFYNRSSFYEQAVRFLLETSGANTAVLAPTRQTLTISTINKKRLKKACWTSYGFMRGLLARL
ncbi:MAG: patatin-like phospholipase family protein [Candidatus Jacksonbacteria bacterium]|nr:patatin-like phospholipase family protein [Candidatus Jacksonbacteria bacterium]